MSSHKAYAATAAHSVLRTFTAKAARIPGTLLGAVHVPDFRSRKEKFAHWHYWWQAHFIDCILDAGFRAHRDGNPEEAIDLLKQAKAVLRGVQLRNFGTYINDYYDDMAWMTLAVERINELSLLLTGKGSTTAQDAGTALYKQLTKAVDSAHGGGAYWSKARDFKNTPANAPIALAFVRAHREAEAVELLNWMHATLWDGADSVYLDGLSLRGKDPVIENGKYSYNAGPVLGALIELSDEAASTLNFDRVGHIHEIINGVFSHFTSEFTDGDGVTRLVLTSGGGGDGGLFPGILARYLALAAHSPLVTSDDAARIKSLLGETAEVIWEGRREFDPDLPMSTPGIDPTSILGKAVALFSPDITRHVSDVLRPGAPAELSNQLTAWMTLEAAATL